MFKGGSEVLDLGLALAGGFGLAIIVLTFSSRKGTLLSLSSVSSLGHQARAENTLGLILRVIINFLKVLLYHVMLAFVFMRAYENVTSLEIWHRRATLSEVRLLCPLVFHLRGESTRHVRMVFRLLFRVTDFVGTAEGVEGLIKKRSMILTLGQETAVGLGAPVTAVVGLKGPVGVLNHFHHVLTVPSLTLISH